MNGEPELTSLTDQLAVIGCDCVYIDLAGVSFVGCTFINFVIRLADQLPDDVPVTLCRPKPLLRRIIELTALTQHALVRADLSPGWSATSPVELA